MLTRRHVLGAVAIGIAPPVLAAPSNTIVVSPASGRMLIFGDLKSPCAVGRTGVRRNKQEGDGATPAGRYPLRRLLFRPDRIASIVTQLPVAQIHPTDGWSDDPDDPLYNQQVALPRTRHYEDLWRSDGLYDIVIVVGYNDAPTIPGKGSAIFLHVASPNMGPTDGCVSLPLPALVKLAGLCDTTTVIDIRS